jgi:hypothetical protein
MTKSKHRKKWREAKCLCGGSMTFSKSRWTCEFDNAPQQAKTSKIDEALELIKNGLSFKPALTPNQFKKYHKDIDKSRKEGISTGLDMARKIIENRIEEIEKIRNTEKGYCWELVIEELKELLKKLEEAK